MRQPAPSPIALPRMFSAALLSDQVEQALAVLRREGVDIHHACNAPACLVGDAGRHHAAVGVAEQGDVLQVLAIEHRGHVVDVRGEVDFVVGEMGPLAQARVGRREELMAGRGEQRPHLLPRPGGRPRTVCKNDRCHASPLEAGEAELWMLLRITRNDSQSNHSTGRGPRGLSWPYPSALRERRQHRPARPGTRTPADRAGLRRGRRRRAAAPGPVRRRSHRRARRPHDHCTAPA